MAGGEGNGADPIDPSWLAGLVSIENVIRHECL